MSQTMTKAKRTMRYRDGRLDITEAGKTDNYRLSPVLDYDGETVLGFRCDKIGGDEPHDIDLASGECSCRGYQRWGKCRHASAVFTLRDMRKI